MSDKLTLKSIYELLDEKSFYIPSYQRGYRWIEQQVKELMDDIWEFHENVELEKNKGFYCLQPIVVKKSNNSDFNWDIIDGQQRLTTIYIILKTAETLLTEDGLKLYKIGYETRTDSGEFLRDKLNEIDESNIDFFHISKTYETVIKWFSDRKGSKSNFIKRLLQAPILDGNADKAKNIRVIWYEVDEGKDNDIEIFTRINMGKIPLTNAELVKALLLQKFEENKEIKQFELASEWDFIEYSLQNDDFWFFINKGKNEKATRIEFIFDLVSENYINREDDEIREFAATLNKPIDKYYVFHIINHMFKNGFTVESVWNEVKNCFRILNEWYEDRELFHKIGFLVIYSDNSMLSMIKGYTETDSTKTEFRHFLDKQIKKIFEKIDIDNISYERDQDSVRKVLLMFNIQTIIQNEKSNIKFQFDRFKKDNWDIEHIRSQTDRYPTKEKEKIEWIEDILGKTDKSKEEIFKMKHDYFKEFYDQMYEKLEGSDGNFNKHRIGNLVLLDSSSNRSYGNAFFPIKRKTILENDKNGTFVPICTKNVFLKYYSQDAKDLQKWNSNDAEDYKKQILKTLNPFLKEEVQDEEQI